MKKILFLLILLLITSNFYAQYLAFPPQSQITTYADTNYSNKVPVYISANNPRFEINRYIGGWQWDQGRTMTKNLLFTQVHSGLSFAASPSAIFPDSVTIVHNADLIGSSTMGFTAMNSACMLWKPTLL